MTEKTSPSKNWRTATIAVPSPIRTEAVPIVEPSARCVWAHADHLTDTDGVIPAPASP